MRGTSECEDQGIVAKHGDYRKVNDLGSMLLCFFITESSFSLLLLSEFHPRSMHFPSGGDEEEMFGPIEGGMTYAPARGSSGGESQFAVWVEPALRSDRMCWSLIGMALSLSYELGVFGEYGDEARANDSGAQGDSNSLIHHQRMDRTKRLLYVYVTQTSGRLGIPSAFPDSLGDRTFASLERTLSAGRCADTSACMFVTTETGETLMPPDYVETVQRSWTELASIMKVLNDKLFCSKQRTTELIKSEEYIEILEQLRPILSSWEKEFQSRDGNSAWPLVEMKALTCCSAGVLANHTLNRV